MTDLTRHFSAPVPAFTAQRVEDLPFRSVPNCTGVVETLALDVYLPPDSFTGLRPAVIWVHGGGFRPGNDKRQVYIPLFAHTFAGRGFVGIAPDYRIRPNPPEDPAGTVWDAVSDLGAALDWVREHASEYRIDPSRIILAGGSAGGMAVLNLVHSARYSLAGVVAVLDLWGTPKVSEGFRLFERVNPATPATFIVHGTADQLVPYDLSPAFKVELEQVGRKAELLTLEGAPHTPLMHFDLIAETIGGFLDKVLANLAKVG